MLDTFDIKRIYPAGGDCGGGTPRPVLLTGAKKSHPGCLISFQLPMGFQNFIKILIKLTLKKILNHKITCIISQFDNDRVYQ